MLYKGLIKQHIRKVTAEIDIPLDRAIRFLIENKQGIVQDYSGKEYTLEELEYVKNIEPESGIGSHSGSTSGGAVFEDTDTKLSELIGDYTE